MTRKGTIVLLLVALCLAVVSLVAGNSFTRLRELRGTLAAERIKNEELSQYVSATKSEVRKLKTNDRALEKAARNELGMARPNEVIFFFEDSKGGDKKDH